MKKLILIRHGKSSWDLPVVDKERPLAHRGIKDAYLMSEKIQSYIPNSYVFWSSTAKRAGETAKIFAQNMRLPDDLIVYKDSLYTFDDRELQNEIKKCEDSYDNLIVFGHNPAITDFVNEFGNIYIDKIKTCGFVSIVFNQNNWSAITRGTVQKIIFPKDFK
jgi:phosphohistidine phosphatase